MSTSTEHEFLLLFRGANWDKGLSTEQLQKIMEQVKAWMETLKLEGKVKGGQPLEATGKLVSGKNGRGVADGPFAESKEAVGGYFLLQAESLDEAVEVARQNPLLEYGVTVEVRPIADECPTMRRVMELVAHA